MIKEIKMRFKTKIVILLAAVLLTVLSFSVVAAYVYSGMLGPAEYTEIEVVTSSMTEAENEPSKGCC
jgi:hypothetical protein